MTPSMVRSMAEAYRTAFQDEAHAIELEALAKTLDRLYADRDALVRVEDELLRLQLLAASLHAGAEALPEWARLRISAMVTKPVGSPSEGDGS